MKQENIIYELSFGADTEFQKELFKTCGKHLKALELDKEVVSLLFSLPCEIKTQESTFKANYIFAAATHPEKRKKGYMERLLRKVCGSGEVFILRPANEGLCSYYEKFGFKKFCATDNEHTDFCIIPEEGFAKIAYKTNEGELTLMSLNSPCDLTGISFPFTMP